MEIKSIINIIVQTIYDIVKAHGGGLKMESKEVEGSEFIIQLSIV
jgi:signal transduction histidine kinase